MRIRSGLIAFLLIPVLLFCPALVFSSEAGAEEEALPHAGEVMILYTSDVHCGIDEGFGYAGLQQLRDELEAQGYETILVDNGDALRGGPAGNLTKGAAIIGLMNDLHYDAAIPGNHDFDCGADRFFRLAELAEFPYVSCNLNKKGSLVFPPYVILEAAGLRIAFVGVTTPQTLSSCAPGTFTDEQGEPLYGFLQDETGEALCQALQEAVDSARAEGADHVYVLGHLGLSDSSRPWTYMDVIPRTSGIDVLLDGHSHDAGQDVVKDRDGKDVTRSACGTRLEYIGYSRISAEDGILETGVLHWPEDMPALSSPKRHVRLSRTLAFLKKLEEPDRE